MTKEAIEQYIDLDKFQYADPSAATNDVTLNNIHATLVLDDIRNRMDSYIGYVIGTDEQMADTERKIQAWVYDRVRTVDPDAIVYISMPRADDGGHSAYLSITTRHPDRWNGIRWSLGRERKRKYDIIMDFATNFINQQRPLPDDDMELLEKNLWSLV